MPLRTGAAQDQRAAAPHHGLPLHGLPAHDRQRLLLERRDPTEGFAVIKGEPVIGGLHGATRHYFARIE